MKKAVIVAERKTEFVEVPTPSAKDDWVLVKVCLIPMCTEYKAFVDGQPQAFLGHEAVGEVAEVAQPGRVAVGDRVVVMPLYACGKCPLCLAGEYIHCQHSLDVAAVTGSPEGSATYAEYLVKPDWMLLPIPDGMSYKHAGMACCGLGPTFHACERMQVGAFDTLLVTGLGPVGLGGVINGRYRGARVIGVDSNSYRAALARDLGACAVVNPEDPDALEQIIDLTNGLGVDKAVECAAVVPAQRLCLDAVRRKGQVCFVGEAGDLTIAVNRDLLRKGLTVHGAWHYNMAHTPRMMQMIGEVTDQLDRQITHTFSLDEIQQAFELQVTGQCGKVVLEV